MLTCRLCGEPKKREEFHHVIHFTKYKKHKVFWCKDCQKQYIDWRKDTEKIKKLQEWNPSGIVAFD